MIQFIALLLGSAHGFYLSFALLTKNNKENNANLILALLIFSFTLKLFSIFLDVTGFSVIGPYLIELDAPIAFLFGPLMFLYVQKLTSPSFYKVNFIHFLPFLLAIVISLPFYWQSAEFKVDWLVDIPTTQFGQFYLILFERVFTPLKLVLITGYLINIYQRLIQHQKDIADNFTNIEKISLTWLTRLFSMIIVLFFCWVFWELIDLYLVSCNANSMGVSCETLEETANHFMLLSEYGLVVCLYLISIYSLKQPAIFTDNSHHVEQKIEANDEKYQKSSLTEESSTQVFQEICRFVRQQKLYLEPDLSLSQLAQQSGFSKHHLSQAINQCANTTFFDFINCMRVEHAKSLLHADNKLNILEVSLEAGFNSRSSFYNAFKKHTQLTPSQFKKQKAINSCPDSRY